MIKYYPGCSKKEQARILAAKIKVAKIWRAAKKSPIIKAWLAHQYFIMIENELKRKQS